jgi:transmembrane sensor
MYQKYTSYQLADFVADEEFVEWVRRPTPRADQYWNEFLEIFPHQRAALHHARQVVRTLIQDSAAEVENADDAREIWMGIEASMEAKRGRVIPFFTGFGQRWAAAVAVICLAGAGWWIGQRSQTSAAISYQSMVQEARAVNPLEEVINTSSTTQTIRLPDGSKIVLEPASQISYVKNFAGKSRVVYLAGAAFFDVTKNPEKPFLVYSNELVTKVLGTRFRIQAFDKEKNIVVSVRTGRVTVYEHHPARNADPETTGLLLTPNQEIQFNRKDERFNRTLVKKPAVLLDREELQQFSFVDAPLNQIFEALEKAYGVDIVFDEEVLSSCHLTTSLSAETLFDKLEVICEAIGASYKVVDAQVVISSKGCGKISE